MDIISYLSVTYAESYFFMIIGKGKQRLKRDDGAQQESNTFFQRWTE